MISFSAFRAARDGWKRGKSPPTWGGGARAGHGAPFLELKSSPFHGHYHADDPHTYRLPEEEESWKARDPLPNFERRVTEQDLMDQVEMERIRNTIDKEIQDAVKLADKSPRTPLEGLYSDV